MHEKRNSLVYWIRWILVIPVALAVGGLVDFPVHFILYKIISAGDTPFITPYPKSLELLVAPFFRALFFVWVGSIIAPKSKITTAKVLVGFWIFFGIVGLIITLYNNSESGDYSLNLWGSPGLTGIIGSFVGFSIVKKKLKEQVQAIRTNSSTAQINND